MCVVVVVMGEGVCGSGGDGGGGDGMIMHV